jgi:hypothetical protein
LTKILQIEMVTCVFAQCLAAFRRTYSWQSLEILAAPATSDFLEHTPASTPGTATTPPLTADTLMTRPLYFINSIVAFTQCVTDSANCDHQKPISHWSITTRLCSTKAPPTYLTPMHTRRAYRIISHPSVLYQTHTHDCETGTRPPAMIDLE